jgi:hypothetical protein
MQSPCLDMDIENEDIPSLPLYVTDIDKDIGRHSSEIYDAVIRKEPKPRFVNSTAKYLKWRRVLVDWMCQFGNEFNFNFTTTHVAVSYLDRYLHSVTISKTKFQLVALACLLIAGIYPYPLSLIF